MSDEPGLWWPVTVSLAEASYATKCCPRVPLSVHDALNLLIAIETRERLPLELEIAIVIRRASSKRHWVAATRTRPP